MTEILAELKEIYCSADVPMSSRIEAAAVVLIHSAPEVLIENATAFLEAVSKAERLSPGYRIAAIKALAKRVVPKAASPGEALAEGEGLGDRLRAARLAAFPVGPAPRPSTHPGLDERLESARKNSGLCVIEGPPKDAA